MGFLTHMTADSNVPRGYRLMKKNVATPFRMNLHVLNGHVTPETQNDVERKESLAETKIERWYLAEGVTRIPVREGRLRGTLFIPKGASMILNIYAFYIMFI